ncbi:MAG: DUF308 domain-containing protein, partial [Christensenellaceae bacterium]
TAHFVYCKQKNRYNILVAILNIFLGLFIWLFHKSIVTVMPILFSIWLIAFGIIRIIEVKKAKKEKVL